jgi:hypothetical protein
MILLIKDIAIVLPSQILDVDLDVDNWAGG